MRYFWNFLLIAVIVATAWFVWWYGWGRLTAGPPDAVVRAFLQASLDKDWAAAQAYMTQHMRGRIGREGFDAMPRFVEARLELFSTFEIVRIAPQDEEADVVVRLLLPVRDWQPVQPATTGMHGTPGRIEGESFVHAHRFQLQREGLGTWRIYQFEEVDERP